MAQMKLALIALLPLCSCVTSDGNLKVYPDEAGYFYSLHEGDTSTDGHYSSSGDYDGWEVGGQITYTGLNTVPSRVRVAGPPTPWGHGAQEETPPGSPEPGTAVCTCQGASGAGVESSLPQALAPPPPGEPPVEPGAPQGSAGGVEALLSNPSTYAILGGGGAGALLLKRMAPTVVPLLFGLFRRKKRTTPSP